MENKIAPILSIIIPVYNTANYLDRCVGSIINQTFKDWELYLIDDGSTDDSYIICQKFAKSDIRIKTISIENGGQGRARNIGLSLIAGKYVMFIDSDDLLLDLNTLNNSVKFLDNHSSIDIVQFPYFRFTNPALFDNNAVQESSYDKDIIITGKSAYVEHTDIVNSVRVRLPILKTAPWGKLYRAELFEDIRFPEGMVYEDTFMFCDLFEKVNAIAFSNTGWYGNFERIDSTTGNSGKPKCKNMEDKIKAFQRILTVLVNTSKDKILIANFYIWLCNLLAAFKAMFGSSFCYDNNSFLKEDKCLKNVGFHGWFILSIGVNNYILLRSKYYLLKNSLLGK